jgi:hypothetical protein
MKPESMQNLNLGYSIYFTIIVLADILKGTNPIVGIIAFMAIYFNYYVIAGLTKNKNEKVRKREEVVKSIFFIVIIILAALHLYLNFFSGRN